MILGNCTAARADQEKGVTATALATGGCRESTVIMFFYTCRGLRRHVEGSVGLPEPLDDWHCGSV